MHFPYVKFHCSIFMTTKLTISFCGWWWPCLNDNFFQLQYTPEPFSYPGSNPLALPIWQSIRHLTIIWSQLPIFQRNVHVKGLEGGKPQREWVPTPTVAAISAWGGFGSGANSSQAHAPFITPRHVQIEKHSPFPAPYMEQISVKEIIQFEGVRQIIPNRHHSGMLCWNPLIWCSWIDSDLPNIWCMRQLCMRSHSKW